MAYEVWAYIPPKTGAQLIGSADDMAGADKLMASATKMPGYQAVYMLNKVTNK